MLTGMAQRLSFGLSRELWLVVVGIFLNSLGYGAVLPFEIIYLHDGRGFSLAVAGIVVATLSVVAVAMAPLAGPLIDRFGARVTAAGAGVALAAGYAGMAFAATPASALAAAVLAGIGNGALNPSQSTLVAVLARADVRHRATAVSRVAANAGYGIGGALGGLLVTYGLDGYVALYLLNAITYLVYVSVLVAVVRESARPEPLARTRGASSTAQSGVGGSEPLARTRGASSTAQSGVGGSEPLARTRGASSTAQSGVGGSEPLARTRGASSTAQFGVGGSEPLAGGYRLVVGDRAFMQLALINLAVIAVGWGVFTWLVPTYAKDGIGLSAPLIGSLFLANAATVVVAQVPVARFAEGRRRVVLMALAASLFVGACLLVLAAGAGSGSAYAALLVAEIAVGLGECFHTAVLMPLVAELAPAGLRGRYMAAMGLSWWLGLALAPALGTPLLGTLPLAVFVGAAVVAATAAVAALALESKLPQASRLTPRPRATFESS